MIFNESSEKPRSFGVLAFRSTKRCNVNKSSVILQVSSFFTTHLIVGELIYVNFR